MPRYHPEISVEWDGKRARYFSHEKRNYNPSFRDVIPLLKERSFFWGKIWLKLFRNVLLIPFLSIKYLIRNEKKDSKF